MRPGGRYVAKDMYKSAGIIEIAAPAESLNAKLTGEDLAETGFMRAAAAHLEKIDIRPKKMLCGRMTSIATPARMLQTRSLMLADLTVGQSVLLQQHGLGAERKLGCGLFLPHKGINDLQRNSE